MGWMGFMTDRPGGYSSNHCTAQFQQMQPTRSSLEKIMWSVRIMVRSDRKTRMCRHTSDDQPSTRIACVLSRADRHDTPDNIADIVGDQQGAGLVDHHADRTPDGMPVLTDDSGQYIPSPEHRPVWKECDRT